VSHGLNEQALVGVTRDQRGAGLAASENVFASLQAQTAEFGVGVAGEALGGQYRPDTVLEELPLIGLCGKRSRQ